MQRLKLLLSHRFFDYMLVYLLIGSSGMTFFYRNDEYIIIGALLSGLIFVIRGRRIDPYYVLVIFLYVVMEFLQMSWFGNYSAKTTIGTVLRISFAYFTVRMVNEKFPETYVNIMVFSALASLVFYALIYVPPVTNFIINKITPYFWPIFKITETRYTTSKNIIVYVYNMSHMYMGRNVGPFWEAGAYGVYLNFALLFNLIKDKNVFSRTNFILLITLGTTLSTGSYASIFFFLFAYYMLRYDVKYKHIYIILMGTIFVLAFFKLSFMQEKIVEKYDEAGYNTHSRFGSAVADFKIWSHQPWLGFGRTSVNVDYLNNLYGIEAHRNNGTTNTLVQYGIFVFIFYWYSIFLSFKRYIGTYYIFPNKRSLSIVALATIMLIGFSQKIFAFPYAWSLIFIHLIPFQYFFDRDKKLAREKEELENSTSDESENTKYLQG